MLHIWYDQCMTDLYRLAMPGFPEAAESAILVSAPPGWVEQTQVICVTHAQSLAKSIRTVTNLVSGGFIFLDPSLPFCVYESMRIRVQHLFLGSIERQGVALADFLEDVECMMRVVEGMQRYFRQAEWLLKEMRAMLKRHGMAPHGGSEGVRCVTILFDFPVPRQMGLTRFPARRPGNRLLPIRGHGVCGACAKWTRHTYRPQLGLHLIRVPRIRGS
jgi:hypothetical protein